MRRAAGWEQDFFSVESMRVITDELQNGEFTTEATVKVWVGDQRSVHTAEGNGPVNAIDTALRAALAAALPGARPRPPRRLQGPHPRRRHGDRRGDPGAHRRHRRRALVDHHRGEQQHHRGVLAGAVRLDRLRPAPLGRGGVELQPPWPPHSSCPASPSTGRAPTHRRTTSPTVDADRPAELRAASPSGNQLGYQGPDQGYGLVLRRSVHGELWPQTGRVGGRRGARVPRRRAAPGVDLRPGAGHPRLHDRLHDLGLARSGSARRAAFRSAGGCSPVSPTRPTTTSRRRAIADQVPEATLRMSPKQVTDAYPDRWRELLAF